MKKITATVLLLCFICILTACQRMTPPLPDPNDDTTPVGDTTVPDEGTGEIGDDADTTGSSDEYIFVNQDGYVCINHYYGPYNSYELLITPAVYVGDTVDLEKDVRIWGESSGEHLIVLVYEKAPEIMDVSERRVTVHTTKDKGKTWVSSELEWQSADDCRIVNMELRTVDDIRETHGSIVLSTNYNRVLFYVTEDGGETWQMRAEVVHPDPMHTGGLVYSDIGFISFTSRAGKGLDIFMSVDGGRSWRLMDIPTPDGYSDEDACVDLVWKYNGVIFLEAIFHTMVDGTLCEVHRTYASSDGGKTWEWEP